MSSLNGPTKRKNGQSTDDPSHPRKKYKTSPPSFSSAGATVKFLIGPDAEPFVVHREFACYHSPVWNAAFNSTLVEGQSQTYTIDDCSVPAFRGLVRWLYTQEIVLEDVQELVNFQNKYRVEGVESLESDTDVNPNTTIITADKASELRCAMAQKGELAYIQLWVLGDRFLIPALQNQAMADLENFTGGACLYLSSIEHIYSNTSPGSPLRHFAVDGTAYDRDWSYSAEHRKVHPPSPEFLEDPMVVLSSVVIKGRQEAKQQDNRSNKFLVEEVRRDYRVTEGDEGS